MEDRQKELKRKKLGEAAGHEPGEKGGSPAEKNVSGLKGGKKPPSSGGETISGNTQTGAGLDDVNPGNSTKSRKSSRLQTMLVFAAAACMLVASGGYIAGKFKGYLTTSGNNVQKLEPVTSIMRPIPLPDYREMLDFLLVYEVGGQRMITAMRMEIGYQNPSRYQYFKEQNVAFRDTIYTFLLKQNPSGNTVKYWHSLLEKDLVDFLRVKLPQSFPDKIRLTQVENLLSQ
jgi:hypothetical protein